MSFRSSIEAGERVKTEMRLTPTIADAATEISRALGIPKNAVFSIALAHFWLTFSALSPRGRKRLELVEALEKQMKDALAEAKNAA